jgi:apolipoprotein N-acyltransferase
MNRQAGQTLRAFALAAFGGVIAFLGFAGFDIWPLALVAFIPLFAAIDLEPTRRTGRVVLLSWVFGLVGIAGGYYWIVEMLDHFSGFPMVFNILIGSLLFAFLGGMFALFGWLWFRATERGYNRTLSAVAAYAAAEMVYPNLFPFYYGVSFHPVPILLQTADLGGPLLVSALCMAVNSALYEAGRAAFGRRPIPRVASLAVAGWAAFALAYGAFRMHQVDAHAAAAEKLTVGLVQVNMGIFDKREDPVEGYRRHVEQTRELERDVQPDLVVWPESAYNFFLPNDVRDVREYVMADLRTPLIFGGLARRMVDGERRLYNTAYLVDGDGIVQGTYDKTYLLAFGEYIPFGETFPILYELSPNSGRFTPGSHVRPLELDGWRITALVCYEDILPSFVRRAVAEGEPHLLVNMTNDAWFGDTTEPWIHLALAKFRAIEHRLALVRVTNSGVSAVVDPAGRTVVSSGVFTRETLHADVPMLQGRTPYQLAGAWPGWLALGGVGWMAFFGRRGQRAEPGSKPRARKTRAQKKGGKSSS